MLDAKFHIYKIVMNSAIDRRLKQIVEIKQIEALYAEFNVSVAHPPMVDNNGRIDQMNLKSNDLFIKKDVLFLFSRTVVINWA